MYLFHNKYLSFLLTGTFAFCTRYIWSSDNINLHFSSDVWFIKWIQRILCSCHLFTRLKKTEKCFWSMQSPYFNTFTKVHPFYFISRSNEVFTVLSTLSKVLIIKPSQKLIYASRDFLWLEWRQKETDVQRKKKYAREPHHAVCACGWQVKRMRANTPDTQLQKYTFKTVSVSSLSTIHNNRSLSQK